MKYQVLINQKNQAIKKKISFSEGSSNSICSNFDLSNRSINKDEGIHKNKTAELLRNSKLSDDIDEEIFNKKGLLKYINIFIEIQNKRKDFELKINESGQMRQIFYSPTYHIKKNLK